MIVNTHTNKGITIYILDGSNYKFSKFRIVWLYIFTESAKCPWHSKSFVVQYWVYLFSVLLLPLTEVFGQNYPLEKDFLHASFWNGSGLIIGKFGLKMVQDRTTGKVNLLVFANHSAVHRGGVNRGMSVVVAVGISKMWLVTGDRWHMHCLPCAIFFLI